MITPATPAQLQQPPPSTSPTTRRTNHITHQPQTFTVPPVKRENKLIGEVAPPKPNKLSRLRSLFEPSKMEDSPKIRKTAATTRKTTSSGRKKVTAQEEIEPHQQAEQEDTSASIQDKVIFKFSEYDKGRQPSIVKTALTVVPLDCPTTTTAVHPACSTRPMQMPSKSPGRQRCLLPLFSPKNELQHGVTNIFCASQAEQPLLMTSQESETSNQ